MKAYNFGNNEIMSNIFDLYILHTKENDDTCGKLELKLILKLFINLLLFIGQSL